VIAPPANVQFIQSGLIFIIPRAFHIGKYARFLRQIVEIVPTGRFIVSLEAESAKDALHGDAREIV
jgi:hypothetical protein